MSSTASYQRKIRAERRALAIDLLGGKCVECGTTERLHFDHVHNDRESLRDMVSALFCCKIERLIAELEKCQLLCASCHAYKTKSDHDKSVVRHGLRGTYMNQRCRCEDCQEAQMAYMRNYRVKVAG